MIADISVEKVLEALDYSEFRSAAQIAKNRSSNIDHVRRSLNEAVIRGLAVAEKFHCVTATGSGYEAKFWRRLRPGETPPLYPEPRGMSTRPLADCWHGYTYKEER